MPVHGTNHGAEGTYHPDDPPIFPSQYIPPPRTTSPSGPSGLIS